VIRPLRRAHRVIVLALAILLPLALAVALLGRPPEPVQHPWISGAQE